MSFGVFLGLVISLICFILLKSIGIYIFIIFISLCLSIVITLLLQHDEVQFLKVNIPRIHIYKFLNILLYIYK